MISPKDFFRITILSAILWSLGCAALVHSARSETLMSAGVREQYINAKSYDYGSDRMARVKRNVVDYGFTSITAYVRLTQQKPTASYVYGPAHKSTDLDIEILISRTNHSQTDFIIKPVISSNPGLGVATRLPGINPDDVDMWFTTYQHSLLPYTQIAAQHEMQELVLGVGLHHLWTAKNAAHWLAFVQDMRRLVGPKLRLSFELSTEKDIKAFEKWSETDSKSFADVMAFIDRIRIGAQLVETTTGAGDWDSGTTAANITANIERAKKVFPKQTLMLANVSIPACRDRNYIEDEVICVTGPAVIDPNQVTRDRDFDYQFKGLKAWLAAVDALDPAIRDSIKEVELLEATTEHDSEPGKEDIRFLMYNKLVNDYFLAVQKKKNLGPAQTLSYPPNGPVPTITIPEAKPAPEVKPEPKKDDSLKDGKAKPKKLGSIQGLIKGRSPAAAGATAPSKNPLSRLDLTSPEPAIEMQKKQICIFYEETGEQKDYLGPIHARLLQSLVGAFREWTATTYRVLGYTKGDLLRCEVAFYISSNFKLKMPEDFMADVSQFVTRRQLIWMNYKLNTFVDYYNAFAAKKGYEKLELTSTKIVPPDSTPTAKNLDPGFYRYFDYKGETFEKVAKWDFVGDWFSSSPEINEVTITDKEKVKVLALARHSKKNTTLPYAVHQALGKTGGVWYLADLPFAFVHYEDRYFILCDLLWDILKEPEPKGPRKALVRIEDVRPAQDLVSLRWAVDYLSDNNVPFAMALIPYYSHVFGTSKPGTQNPEWKPINKFHEFAGIMKYAKARGANFVMHGVAHQAGDLISGYDGDSGSDFEFWTYPENGPLKQDSSDYVIDMIEKGEGVMNKMGIRPVAWEVPHYAASALDYTLFGKLFEWQYHRSIYFKAELVDDAPLGPKHRMFDCVTDECRQERRLLARQMKVRADYGAFGGQIVPYPIWKNSYGESIIPETLGYPDYAFFHENTQFPVTKVEDILKRAKLLRVVRGAWASFFWHPDLANPELPYYKSHPGHYEKVGGRKTLTRIVEGIRALGYEFQSISDCKLFPRAECSK